MTPAWALGLFALWLALMPLLVRRGWPLGGVILAAAVCLALGLGRGLAGLWADARLVTVDPNLLELMAVIVLIYQFSFLLKTTRRMEAIAVVLQRTMRDPRYVLVAVPALVGLIPMPGGAMFTAPLTDEVGNSIDLAAEDKVFTNYWFRHCWELAFPLYPGIILCAGVVGLPPLTLAAALLPLAITAFAAGMALFLWRARSPGTAQARVATPFHPEAAPPSYEGDPDMTPALISAAGGLPQVDDTPSSQGSHLSREPSNVASPGARNPGLGVLWPILLVVGIALARIPLVPGLVGVIVVYAQAERVGWGEFLRQFRDSFNGPILVLVWAVFLFGQVLTSTGLLRLLADSLLGLGLPVAVLTFVLPFLMGALTGVTPGFVGTVFPFLLPFWSEDPVGWLQFAYASGLAGVFLTPAHLCLSMTQEYFRAPLRGVLWLLLPPVAAVVAVAALRLAW
ncbi:MAG: DUF401 family protein [Candidatus Riflebacteria bacterium]|nr:DUF401 family protein [Candidatus Riflebacteria bacterium]